MFLYTLRHRDDSNQKLFPLDLFHSNVDFLLPIPQTQTQISRTNFRLPSRLKNLGIHHIKLLQYVGKDKRDSGRI